MQMLLFPDPRPLVERLGKNFFLQVPESPGVYLMRDVADTVPEFLESGGFSPVGFIAFDLDYYTSTLAALRIFDGPDAYYLPRVLTYFDDISSGEQQYFCEDVGVFHQGQVRRAVAALLQLLRPVVGHAPIRDGGGEDGGIGRQCGEYRIEHLLRRLDPD